MSFAEVSLALFPEAVGTQALIVAGNSIGLDEARTLNKLRVFHQRSLWAVQQSAATEPQQETLSETIAATSADAVKHLLAGWRSASDELITSYHFDKDSDTLSILHSIPPCDGKTPNKEAWEGALYKIKAAKVAGAGKAPVILEGWIRGMAQIDSDESLPSELRDDAIRRRVLEQKLNDAIDAVEVKLKDEDTINVTAVWKLAVSYARSNRYDTLLEKWNGGEPPEFSLTWEVESSENRCHLTFVPEDLARGFIFDWKDASEIWVCSDAAEVSSSE